jgi:hypothetical protein
MPLQYVVRLARLQVVHVLNLKIYKILIISKLIQIIQRPLTGAALSTLPRGYGYIWLGLPLFAYKPSGAGFFLGFACCYTF